MSLSLREPPIPDSPIARWEPRWKLAAFLVAGICIAMLQHWFSAGIACLLAFGLASLSRLPLKVQWGRVGLLMIAVLPVLIILPLTSAGSTWTIGWVNISEEGLATAFTIAFRAIALALLTLIVLRTAPLPETLAAAHSLRIPGLAVQVAQLAYRYSFLFFEEARRLRIALRTRGYRTAVQTHSYRTMGHAAGTLLVRGGDRAERVADAMRCRGFDGHFHCLRQFHATFTDSLKFLSFVSLSLALLLWDRFA